MAKKGDNVTVKGSDGKSRSGVATESTRSGFWGNPLDGDSGRTTIVDRDGETRVGQVTNNRGSKRR